MTNKFHNWRNANNLPTYKKLPFNKLKEYTSLVGLNTYCDLKLLNSYIKQASSILEVGAGSGRVLDYLIKTNYHGKILAIEHSPRFCKQLKGKFGNQVTLYQQNLLVMNLPEKVDLVLWMWSGIADFSKAEHLKALEQLRSTLNPGGFLIFDTMNPKIKPTLTKCNKGQEYIVDTHYGLIYTYSITEQETENYAAQLNMEVIDRLYYTTSAHKERILHILKKSS